MNLEVYLDRLGEAARKDHFLFSIYGRIGDIDLPVLQRDADTDKPRVYMAAGVHGNEPAGPMAILELLKRKCLPRDLQYVIFPLVNPEGLVAGTRENAEGIDLNRDYGLQPRSQETRLQLDWIGQRCFDLVLCLHEDDDGTGFYIYQHLRHPSPTDYSGLAIEAARPWTGIDSREEIDEMPARNGRMYPPHSVLDFNREDLPEALRLYFHHGADYTFTTETPSSHPIVNRIGAQCAVVEKLLGAFIEERIDQ